MRALRAWVGALLSVVVAGCSQAPGGKSFSRQVPETVTVPPELATLVDRWERAPTLGFGERDAILADRGLPIPGQIRGRFARTSRGVQVRGQAAC